jgi:hypothetical protein
VRRRCRRSGAFGVLCTANYIWLRIEAICVGWEGHDADGVFAAGPLLTDCGYVDVWVTKAKEHIGFPNFHSTAPHS